MPPEDQHTYRFTDHETTVLAGLVRDNLRRTVRKAHAGQAKFGADWDDTTKRERVATLRRIYIELGGDPDRISNVPPYPASRDDAGE